MSCFTGSVHFAIHPPSVHPLPEQHEPEPEGEGHPAQAVDVQLTGGGIGGDAPGEEDGSQGAGEAHVSGEDLIP